MGKENLCSCLECLNGNLDKCEFEPCRIIKKGDVNSEDDKIDGSEYEENEIPKESLFSCIKKGACVALYSPPQASELFCLCKVLSCETATASISDANDHTVLQGMKYIRAHYLEKVKEKKNLVHYKRLSKKKKFFFFLSKYFILMYLRQRNSLLTLKIINFYLIVSDLIISSS